MAPIPSIGWVAGTFTIWFILTLLMRHPGIAAISTAIIMTIFFPLT